MQNCKELLTGAPPVNTFIQKSNDLQSNLGLKLKFGFIRLDQTFQNFNQNYLGLFNFVEELKDQREMKFNEHKRDY